MTEQSYIAPPRRALNRSGIQTLLLVQLLTLLFFVPYVPNWLLVVYALVLFWRWRVLHGELRTPPRWLTWTALASGVLAMLATGIRTYDLDSAVALCLLCYLLKSLEVIRRRDAIVQLYLGFFLIGVLLLYRYDLIGGLMMIILLTAHIFALQAVTAELSFHWGYAIKQSAVMLLSAIPIMVLGYLFFPRLPPLWQVPQEGRNAVTGMSDELNPGSVAALARSTAPAFRVVFDEAPPPRSQWYWRGNTLSDFDGERWRSAYSAELLDAAAPNSALPLAAGALYSYQIIMESSGRHWLYFMDWPTTISGEQLRLLPDARAAADQPLSFLYQYRASSSMQVVWPPQQAIINANLQLPISGNERLRAWAQARHQQSVSDVDFIQQLLRHIRQQDYFYTLRPPRYEGTDAIEDFWLSGRSGFCEHYASAVAFILRSVGIPARLVGGYLGGRYIEAGDYIQVRQMEAHAWVEAWVENRWLRLDPTAAVAPGRIEINVDDLFSATQSADLPVLSRIQRLTLIKQLAQYWDSLNYQWQVLVLNYDNGRALNWFAHRFGGVSPIKLTALVLLTLALVTLVIFIVTGILRLPRRHKEPHRSLRKLQRWYGPMQLGESCSAYFARLTATNPTHVALKPLALLVERALYDPAYQIDSAQLKRHLRALFNQRRRRRHLKN